jgi:hypothetical protein
MRERGRVEEMLPRLDHKPCRSCATPIRRAAQRCPHCHANQKLFNLGEGSAVVSALAASIAVIAAAWPSLQVWLSAPYAKLSFDVAKIPGPISADGRFIVVVRNTGGHDGYIWGMSADVEREKKARAFELPHFYEFDMRPRNFEDTPSHFLKVPRRGEATFFATMKSYEPLLDRQGDVRCSLSMTYFGGKPGPEFENGRVEKAIECGPYLPLLTFESFSELADMLRATGQIEMLQRVERDEQSVRRKRANIPGSQP